MKNTSPCCGYKTFDEQPPGTYDICSNCFWNGIQNDDLDCDGGANIPSLRQAQKNDIIYRACAERCIEFIRKPNVSDVKDPNWKPFSVSQ
ncbi:CPCC family cysteine-rich protein [Metabacillus malikii]|uniref:Cysteine-rich CPCC domain-containing protein n=1 Tax=Metabacillus malikii TaxID=1504265 RepID=A0ABT9ZLW3_9BACI|nr:CPCC family cysteine-rich protein [Metabacillus malikii]MDQ0233249.1 hypothetical protein [Metabacillus malikii]